MALVNGGSPRNEGHRLASLGKRKRSVSPDISRPEHETFESKETKVQEGIQVLLKLLRNYDPSPSLLKQPLPVKLQVEPEAKRTRLFKSTDRPDNIEGRASSGYYNSIQQLVEDVNHAASEILGTNQARTEQVNGGKGHESLVDSKAKEQIEDIKALLTKQLRRMEVRYPNDNATESSEGLDELELRDSDKRDQSKILTLRTQTEKGPRQVYSGLQHPGRLGKGPQENSSPKLYPPIDGRKLPNGFELAEVSLVYAQTNQKTISEARTFGEVFKAHRNLKGIEQPRPSPNIAKGSTHHFRSPSDCFFERATPTYKQDYKFMRLPTSRWLSYDDTTATTISRQGEWSSSVRAARVGNDGKGGEKTLDALFLSSYSAFAPTIDNSTAVVPEKVRSQLWWSTLGQKRFTKFLSVQYPESGLSEVTPNAAMAADEDFADVATNFQTSEADSNMFGVDGRSAPDDVDSLLVEVSHLLETLTSYQRIRSLESSKTSTSSALLTPAEFDTYELLRSQLVILIESLPPFAVAKLDGDQLEALSISTKLVIEGPDFPGTGEVDDFTSQRRKAAAAAASAASRTSSATPASVRPSTYQTPSGAAANAVNYRARNLNASVPPQGFSSTSNPAQSYQTPRPSVPAQGSTYTQRPYQQSATPYAQQPTVQQFQRPMPNGYTAYQSNTPSQTTYLQRPSQPGYQQRAQETTAIYARSASPQKPLVNGQTYSQPQTQSPYAQHQQIPPPRLNPTVGTTAAVMQHATDEQRTNIERVRLQQQQAQQQSAQRQAPSTPLPQIPGVTAALGTQDTTDGQSQTPGSSMEISASVSTPAVVVDGLR